MDKTSDHYNTTEWALAHVDGASFIASGQHFMLANRVTGRAHSLYFLGGGLTLGISKPGGPQKKLRNLSYYSFRTKRSVQFSDFHGRGARISAIRLPIYSKTYFIIYGGLNPFGQKLAQITMGGFSTPKLSVSGQAFVNGALAVDYGDGELNGRIQHVLEFKEDYGPRNPRDSHFRSAPSENKLMILPGDVMFDFNSHKLKANARSVLEETLIAIEMQNQRQVNIEGHTDAVGGDLYNMGLSLKRADSVKQWLIKNGCEGARKFTVEGFGESRPRAQNKFPDGRDNKEGRAQNRRVEIRFKK